ncbi:MAG: GNAT family N-acetyltransferase [Gemmatimonadetes bacterium]|nr:GNAT family N-acetyltransferase [Gemmatimonadota bacterium]MYF18591.1 GNAT family N-acetyltransferase [Gemmatimonadota bacterium]
MVEIRKLKRLWREDLHIVDGYVSTDRYHVSKTETADEFCFTLKRQKLNEPYLKRWSFSDEDFRSYSELVNQSLSMGAYDAEQLVGIAISEKIEWNRSLWIREFGVDGSYRRKGVGRQLMDQVAEVAKAEGLRILVCETQNTNVPAIDFYRSVGFEVEGIDLSYYTNRDVEGEVAIFMKRKLA